jgi:hypothetical protein
MEISARLYKLFYYLTSALIMKFSDWSRRWGADSSKVVFAEYTAAGGLSLQNKKKRKKWYEY